MLKLINHFFKDNALEILRRTALYSWIVRAILRDFHWIRAVEIRYQKWFLRRKYHRWIREHETSAESPEKPAYIGSQPPNFLIIQSFKKSSKEVLMNAIEFIQSQTYPHWRYSLIINNIQDQHFMSFLDDCSSQDPRISITLGNKAHIEEVHNLTKQFVIFLHEQGRLNSRALEKFAKIIVEQPEVEWIYSDEDQMDANANRHTPWFKPDWSPELLLSINYLRPAVIRYDLLNGAAEIWRQIGTDLFWSLLLDLITSTTLISHVSQILYHHTSDTADCNVAPLPNNVHANWVERYLQSNGKDSVIVRRRSNGILRASWETSSPFVSIVIPTLEKIHRLRNCIQSLFRITEYVNFEIVLVDTGSRSKASQRYYEELEGESRIRIYRREGEFNYSAVNNFGLQKSKGDITLFLNNDVEIIDREWLDELVRWSEIPDIGVVGAKLIYPNRSIQHAGVILGLGGHAGHIFLGAEESDRGVFGSTEWYRNYLAVSGACMMVRRDVVEEVAGFDERFQLVFGDIDFCLRIIEMGYRVMYTPFARLIHHEGTTRFRYNPRSDLKLALEVFRKKIKDGDPYYNPNLSYARPYPRLVSKEEEDRESRVARNSNR